MTTALTICAVLFVANLIWMWQLYKRHQLRTTRKVLAFRTVDGGYEIEFSNALGENGTIRGRSLFWRFYPCATECSFGLCQWANQVVIARRWAS